MTSPVVCLVALLCLSVQQASADEGFSVKHTACDNVCSDYMRWAYGCTQRADCFTQLKTSQQAFEDCVTPCYDPATACNMKCVENYDSLTVDNCDGNCLRDAFFEQFRSSLPPLTDQDVGVFQGVPFFEDLHDGSDEDTEADDK